MSTRKISLLALFLALSVVGAAIKIPAFVGSIALDAFPALLAAVFISRGSGAIVAGVGHFLSAFIAGMPLGPAHLIIALEMAIIVWSFAFIYEKGKRLFASLFFVLSNSLLAPVPMIFLFGIGFYVIVLPSLLVGATFNMIIAYVIIPRFSNMFTNKMWSTSR